MTSEITAAAYSGSSPATLISTLGTSRQRSWLDPLCQPGSGSLQLHLLDADLAAHPTIKQYGTIIRTAIDGVDKFAFVVEQRTFAVAPQDENAGRWWTLTGRGVLALLERAIVMPEGAIVGSTARQRTFDFTAIAYDDSTWIAATQIQRQDDLLTTLHHSLLWRKNPVSWPDPFAYWIWSRSPSGGSNSANQPLGTSYFRKTFTVANTLSAAVVATIDNYGRVWLDGQLIIDNVPDGSWRESYRADVTLGAGTHQIAVEGTNKPLPFGATSPAGVLVSVIETDSGGALSTNVITRTDSSWLALDYPASVPGMSIGFIWRTLIEEAQARGALPGITLGFTDTLDSNGNAWAIEPDLALDIGTNLLNVAQTFVEQYVDVEVTPTLVLNLYNKGTLGSDLTATINLRASPAGLVAKGEWRAATAYVINDSVWYAGNPYYAIANNTNFQPDTNPAKWAEVHFEEMSSSGQDDTVNAILARDTTGALTTRDDATSLASHPRKEEYVEMALAPSQSRAEAMADQIFTESGIPSLQISAKVTKHSGVCNTWTRGDKVSMPATDLTPVATNVYSVGVEEDEAGHPIFNVQATQDDI